MSRITLVRHGQAEAGWAEDADPALSELGMVQAEACAAVLSAGEPIPVITSPLLRARQTAAPLAEAWSTMVRIDPDFGEIPSPSSDLAQRAAWLMGLMGATWDDVDKATRVWRLDVLTTLMSLDTDTIVFTHYMAINVAVGEATMDRRVFCCAPDYCSRTLFEVGAGGLHLVSLGEQADTIIR
ncbi:MAG TPA: histidine phosphatase family protein [Acidimicrobiales bacterium]|nr:histidine phosphatase family protein [Acidimicrobiales bacterium]